MFAEILDNKKITIKDICIGTGIPRSTISDLVNGKTSIEKMSAGNLYKLSQYLQINMQDLYAYCCLPKIEDVAIFIESENEKILDDGLKCYINELSRNNLVETSYALNDQVRFQKYASAISNFYKYRKLTLPERYEKYVDLAEKQG